MKYLIMTALSLGITLANGQKIESLGIMEFNDEGILFVGDNNSGYIHALDFTSEDQKENDFEINIYNVDAQVSAVIGTAQGNVNINDIAVHPKSGEVYLSVTRGHGLEALPALMKVTAKNQIVTIDLSKISATSQSLSKLPDAEKNVGLRGTAGSPPTPKEIAKSKRSLRTLAIVAMEYYNGELFVAGISNEEFCSVLRRIPYPFNGTESISNIEMYHIVHDNYESRAPIRSMAVKTIDGIDQLVAAYTCSPLVLIPLKDLKNGEKVKAKTLGDMGNGQPIDMVPFSLKGEEMLFVTNNSRSPMVIPVKGLNGAKGVTKSDFKRGPKLDINPIMPYGPVGKAVMFTGSSLRIDLLNESKFISLNRDFETGNLDLISLNTFVPFRLHNIVGEHDVPVQK
ncbi:MAG: hypothetical protein JXQ87_15580 [Bacteroidia bacterium]